MPFLNKTKPREKEFSNIKHLHLSYMWRGRKQKAKKIPGETIGLLKTIVLALVSARKEGLKTASQGRIRITKHWSNFKEILRNWLSLT
jgi:hypothetical protein